MKKYGSGGVVFGAAFVAAMVFAQPNAHAACESGDEDAKLRCISRTLDQLEDQTRRMSDVLRSLQEDIRDLRNDTEDAKRDTSGANRRLNDLENRLRAVERR